jgi:ribosomal protein S18 acetylase RimI-like enzyme
MEMLLEMGRVGGGEERRDAEVVWTVGGSPVGQHNAVLYCHTSPDRADVLIEEWLGELRRRDLPGSWHRSPAMRPDDLSERLVASGFEDVGDEPAMAADLTVAPGAVEVPEGFAVERVTDDAGLEAYRRVLASGFGEGPKEADWVAEVYRRIGLGDQTPWCHHVGRMGEEPVSTVSTFDTNGVAGLYFVSTAPEARRRGIGAATTRHAMVEARARGCNTAVLGSSPMGYSVYRRLGFDDVFRWRIFEWPPQTS